MHPELAQILEHYNAVLDLYESGQIGYEAAVEQVRSFVATDAAGWSWAVDPDSGVLYRWSDTVEPAVADPALFVAAPPASLGPSGGFFGGMVGDTSPAVAPTPMGFVRPQRGGDPDEEEPRTKGRARDKAPRSPKAPRGGGSGDAYETSRKRGWSTWLLVGLVVLVGGAVGYQKLSATKSAPSTTIPVVTTTSIPTVTTTTTTLPVTTTTRPVTTTTRSVTKTTHPVSAPAAPVGVVATSGTEYATVTWGEPAAGPVSYFVASALGTSRTCMSRAHVCKITGLTPGARYQFRVVAHGVGGVSASGASAPIIIKAPVRIYAPSAPTKPTASAGNAQVTISWTPGVVNVNHNAPAHYTATATPGGLTCAVSTTSCSITGLTNGTSYTFSVVATNAGGSSAASPASAAVTPSTTPSAPGTPSAAVTARSTSVTVSWTSGDDGGAAITRYTVTSTPASAGCTSVTGTSPAVASCVVSDLSFATSYTFSVVATNANGDSPSSAPSAAVTPYTVPGAPSTVVVVANKTTRSAQLSWHAPTASGGSPITAYTVTSAPAGKGCVSITLVCTVTGLSADTSYTFTVAATNAAGVGPSSPRSVVLRFVVVPTASAPAGFRVIYGLSGSATTMGVARTVLARALWVASSAPRGYPVTAYRVTTLPATAGCTTRATWCSLGGLHAGISYTVHVVAVNAGGASAPAAALLGIPGLPGTPTNLHPSVLGYNDTLRITAKIPSNGGSPITGWGVFLVNKPVPGTRCSGVTPGATVTCTVTKSASFDPLKDNSLLLYLSAMNAVGYGPGVV
jgi:hypothetical protein